MSDEAEELQTNFKKVVHHRKRGTDTTKYLDLLSPFDNMTNYRFKQTFDTMEIRIQAGCKALPDVGLLRRLAFHVVVNGFTEPQNFEGITIGDSRST